MILGNISKGVYVFNPKVFEKSNTYSKIKSNDLLKCFQIKFWISYFHIIQFVYDKGVFKKNYSEILRILSKVLMLMSRMSRPTEVGPDKVGIRVTSKSYFPSTLVSWSTIQVSLCPVYIFNELNVILYDMIVWQIQLLTRDQSIFL